MRCLDHCNHKWNTDNGVELKCDREDGHTGVHAAMHPSEGRICVCPETPAEVMSYQPKDSEPVQCFHCGRSLVDRGKEDPDVDRLELTMRFQKWSLDISAITYLCACGANTTRLENVTAAYHDTWDREFGD